MNGTKVTTQYDFVFQVVDGLKQKYTEENTATMISELLCCSWSLAIKCIENNMATMILCFNVVDGLAIIYAEETMATMILSVMLMASCNNIQRRDCDHYDCLL